ncbi:MAG: DUF4430 domain-containing protein [Candidatus Micrarchaeota archaeon]
MKKLFFLAVFFIFLAGCVQQTPQQAQPGEIALNVSIDYAGLQPNYFAQTTVADGSTALEAFSKVANLSTKTFSFGLYVNGVNAVMEDNEKHLYWQYYVDGELAPVGVDAFKIDKPVSLEFRLETPPEDWS